MRKMLEKAYKEWDSLEREACSAAGCTSAATDSFRADDASSAQSTAFSLHYATAPDLLDRSNQDHSSNKTKATAAMQQCLDLFEANMSDLYKASSWGLDMNLKQSEFKHEKARFLLVQTSTEISKSELVAFVCFRFELDDEEQPTGVVLYVYEVQIAVPYRRQGLGRRLMAAVEYIAQTVGFPKVMLTVFKRNQDALIFYRDNLRYQIDESSPSQHGAAEDYEILSKPIALPPTKS